MSGARILAHQQDNVVVFRSDPQVLSSVLTEKRLRFTLQWKQWKPRTITINLAGILQYKSDEKDPGDELNIRHCHLSYIPEDILVSTLPPESLASFTGFTLKCRTKDGYDTYFRCIIEREQFERMKSAVKLASLDHNLEKLGPIPKLSTQNKTRSGSGETDQEMTAMVGGSFSDVPVDGSGSSRKSDSSNQNSSHSRGSISFFSALRGSSGSGSGGSNITSSVMRRTIAAAMDRFDVRSRHEQIVSKRGALRWLPTLFDNDLIHGSWYATPLAVTTIVVPALLNTLCVNSFTC
jgi:hypothetical protein